MSVSNQHLAVLRSVLGNKVVSYHPVFARALGSVPAAVMLSQAYFWQENAQHRDLKEIEGRMCFTKTAAEWYDATGVTDDAQVTARNVLNSSGFWYEKRAGLPAKLYFHVDLESLVSVIYGYLNSGIQVSVDNRSKNRQYTRSSDGTFRQPVSVNYGNNIINVESNKRVLESRERGDARAERQPLLESKKGKKPPSSARPPAPAGSPAATTFSETIWLTATAGTWATALHEYDPETVDADADYYRARCRDWSAQNPGKPCANWLAKAAQFIRDDRAKNRLHTIQPIDNASNTAPSGAGRQGRLTFDRTDIVERAKRTAERLGRSNGIQ